MEREALKEVDVPKQSEEIKIHEIDEERFDEVNTPKYHISVIWNAFSNINNIILLKIYKDTQEKISEIFTEINEEMNDEDFKKALNDVKKIVDKLFKEQILKEIEEQKEENFNVLLWKNYFSDVYCI